MADSDYVLDHMCVRGQEWLVIAATHPDADDKLDRHHFLLFWLDGEWYEEFFPNVHFQRIELVDRASPRMFALTVDGNLRVYSEDGTSIERIDASSDGFNELTWSLDVAAVDGSIFVSGMDRKVYERRKPDRWLPIGPSAPSDPRFGFQSIDGFSTSEIYTVGFGGEIWWRDGNQWSSVVSPTNVILQTVNCGPGEFAYASGASGLLLRGRGDRWEVIQQDLTAKTFWRATFHRDTLYLITSSGLYRLSEEGELQEVPVPIEGTGALVDLSVWNEELWLLGHAKILRTDGQDWEEHPNPTRRR